MIKDKRRILVVAGEASGDLHAAKLVRAMKEASPAADFEFFGATGVHLCEAGVETIVRSDDFSIVGLPEIARALPMFWNAFKLLRNAAVSRKADAVILVDFPDFNLKLAKSFKKKGVKVIYYISPQLWAWRKYRVKTVAKFVDLMLTILPFEKDWYAEKGIAHVQYVGSPTVREVYSKQTKTEFCALHEIDENKPIVALLPGSRHKEIVKILPAMLETASLMAEKNAEIQFVVPPAATRKKAEFDAAVERIKNKNIAPPKNLFVVQNETHEALNAADAAAVASGTATLETAIIGTPLAIVYKTSPFNYKLLRPLISVEHFGLINLIAGERIARELIQDDFTKEVLGDELFRLLQPETNKQMREKLAEATDRLGHGGASKRAAEAILKII